LPSARYEPRRPAEDVLYQIVQAHFETFRAQAASRRESNAKDFADIPGLKMVVLKLP
jgi:hypothetical protein